MLNFINILFQTSKGGLICGKISQTGKYIMKLMKMVKLGTIQNYLQGKSNSYKSRGINEIKYL